MTYPSSDSLAPAAPVEEASIWEDFIDIVVAPAKVFRRREMGSWFKPLLIVTILITVLALASRGVLRPVMDAEFEKAAEQMRRNPQMTEEMIEKARSFTGWIQLVGVPIVIPITIILLGFVLWLVGKLVDSRQELHAALVVASYAMVPRVFQYILNLIQGLVLDPASLTGIVKLSLSPARFLDASASPVVVQLLNRFDLFTIWATVLLGIGLYVTGRVSRSRAAIAATIIWILGAIPPLLGALRQSAG